VFEFGEKERGQCFGFPYRQFRYKPVRYGFGGSFRNEGGFATRLADRHGRQRPIRSTSLDQEARVGLFSAGDLAS